MKLPPHQVQLEYNLSYEEKALSYQDQWYMYYHKYTSKRTFGDTYFKNIMIFQADVGSGMKIQNTHNSQKNANSICESRVFFLMYFLGANDQQEVQAEPWECVFTRNS